MNIRVDLDYPIKDGTEVVFRSPVDCSQVTGLKVYYLENGITTSKEFAFADAHGNNVGDIDHLFAENVAVKVILDVTTGMAFVQNADTNAYLEGRFAECANALKGSASGEVVALTDVSPIEHEMSVKVDTPNATVTKYGKNIFDQDAIFASLRYVKQEDGTWLGRTYHGKAFTFPTQRKGSVYVQVTAKDNGVKSVPFRLQLVYTDGTDDTLITVNASHTTLTTLKGVSNADKTVSFVRISQGGANENLAGAFYIRDAIISYADGEYEPYKEPATYTADANGDVKGVTSLAPSTTLIAESGATVTAEYNKDTNKVIESLVQAIISLGGNV